MSVAEAAHRPARTGRTLALWLGFLIIIAAAIGLAWHGAGFLRPEVSASGLQFRTLKAGTGEPIGSNDAAMIEYIGTLDDGTVFDSSAKQGGPQPFTMGAVFPGFAEAMAKMQEGGHYKFTMPQRLAFGTGPVPPGFPPNSNLTFEVQVAKVARGGAAMMGYMRPRQQ